MYSKVSSGTQEIQGMSIRKAKEIFQPKTGRRSHTHPLEVRPLHGSDEVNESSWSDGGGKKWIGFKFLAPFSEKTKRDKDEKCIII